MLCLMFNNISLWQVTGEKIKPLFDKLRAKPNDFTEAQSEQLQQAAKAFIDQLDEFSKLYTKPGYEKLAANNFPKEEEKVKAARAKLHLSS